MAGRKTDLNSLERLAALHASGLMDSPAEPAFDSVTRLATSVLRVPVALISLVSADRQFFKSQCGLPEPVASERQTPLSHSFCKHVVESCKPLIISDARLDETLRTNLAITDLNVVAYAGVPIIDSEGFVLGSMCAIDTKPRQWSADDMKVLEGLAKQVIVELQLRRNSLALSQQLDRQRADAAERHLFARLNVHDVRTPLAALLMGMDLIKRMGPLTEHQRNYMALCDRNAKVVLNMLDNLLDISNVENRGAAALQLGECDPRQIAVAAVEQVANLAAEKGVELTCGVPEGLPKLLADGNKLERVLVNLLSNSIKFTASGGTVWVTASCCDEQNPRLAQYSVSDTGVGISDLSRIFDEGVFLDQNAVTRRSTGLGLTFCKRIVEAHGGRIWVDTKVGVGSTFHFTVPTQKSPQ